MAQQVLIIAAEASSALYAERLLQHWDQKATEGFEKPHCFGVGNYKMESLGFEILGRSEEMAVVGLQEVIAHWSLIKSNYQNILREAAIRKPKFALLLDYPEFNLRMAKDLKALGIKVIYYISPQIWAWRTGRVHNIKKVVDRMLVILPFEKEFYQKYNVPVDFVGHPLLDEINPRLFERSFIDLKREKFGLSKTDFVLGLMPGSRKSEIKHHLAAQLEASRILLKKYPHLKVVLLLAPTLDRDLIAHHLIGYDMPIQIVKDEPMEMIAMTDMILVASGTATLMVGLLHKPMVIMYKMNALSAKIAKWLVTKTPFFGMANLILGERAVPELFQEQADPPFLAAELSLYIDSKQKYNETSAKLSQLQSKLGERAATVRVANILEEYL
jgi:lipid-A-disaccharide synthase